MIHDVPYAEHAAVAVPDHDRIGESPRGEPLRGGPVVRNRLGS
jgi:hypothetical protein